MMTGNPGEDHKMTLKTKNHHRKVLGEYSGRGLIILIVFVLNGCAPREPSTPTLSPPTPSRTAVQLGPTSTFTPTATLAPTSIPTATLFPLAPVSDADWSRGPRDAAVTLVVYSDFQ